MLNSFVGFFCCKFGMFFDCERNLADPGKSQFGQGMSVRLSLFLKLCNFLGDAGVDNVFWAAVVAYSPAGG